MQASRKLAGNSINTLGWVHVMVQHLNLQELSLMPDHSQAL
jgi:hypothetical protein